MKHFKKPSGGRNFRGGTQRRITGKRHRITEPSTRPNIRPTRRCAAAFIALDVFNYNPFLIEKLSLVFSFLIHCRPISIVVKYFENSDTKAVLIF